MNKFLRLSVSLFFISFLVFSGIIGVSSSSLNRGSDSLGSSSILQANNANNNGTLRLTLVGLPSTLNELNASENYLTGNICVSCWQIIQLEYASGMPVLQDGSYNTKAGLFDWFSATPNASVWDFNIRPNATWSDGIPITSADINFTLSIAQSLFTLWSGQSKYVVPTILSLGALTPPIENVKEVNSSETQITLYTGDSTFGSLVSSQYFFSLLPMHIWQTRNITNDLNFAQDVTSGPFYHLNYTAGSSILVLEKNPYYWDGPNISEIIVTFVSNDNEAVSLLQRNETDLAEIPPANASSFLTNSSFGTDVEPDRGLLYLGYNVTAQPFSTPGFREALADSINTNAIVQSVYDGYATPGYKGEGLIPPSATMWYNTSETQYQYNLALAAKNLTNLGYKTGLDGKLEYSNGTQIKFTIYTDTNNSVDLQAAQIVQSDLSSLNMSVNLIAEPLSQLIAMNIYYPHGNITNEFIVASTPIPLFGVGYADVLPAYENYLPWSPNLSYATYSWFAPQSVETEYNNLISMLDGSTNPSIMQDTVMNIDGLNSQYLPLIPLAYPDLIWTYRNTSFTGFPNSSSSEGFDIGALTLDPTSFSSISATCTPNCPPINTTSLTSTTTSSTFSTTTPSSSTSSSSSSSSSTSSSSTSVVPTPPNRDLYLAVAIIVVVALIAVTTYLARRNRSAKNT